MPHAHPYIPDSLRIGSGSHASLPPDPVPVPAPDPDLQAATGVPLTYRSTDPPNPIQGPDIPFQPAMDRLHETLTKAVTFFAALHGEYERDTASIRAYVDAGVLDRIWKCKLGGNGPGKMSVWVFCQRWYKMRKNKYRMHMPLQLQNESQSRSQRRHPAYRDWILRVRYDLSMAEMALWSIRESNSRDGGCFPDTHAVGQLYTKFNTQCPVLRKLCEDVDKRESCVEFVREASQLLLWMDENMDWWKTSRMSGRLALRRWFF